MILPFIRHFGIDFAFLNTCTKKHIPAGICFFVAVFKNAKSMPKWRHRFCGTEGSIFRLGKSPPAMKLRFIENTRTVGNGWPVGTIGFQFIKLIGRQIANCSHIETWKNKENFIHSQFNPFIFTTTLALVLLKYSKHTRCTDFGPQTI